MRVTAAPLPAATREAAHVSAVPTLTPTAAANPSATTAETTPGALDPLTRVNVASWWKLGGSAADLDRSIDTCVGQLGAPHRPDPGATVVTAGLRACLRAGGWYTVGGSAPR